MMQNHYRFESSCLLSEREIYYKFHISISFVAGKTTRAKAKSHFTKLFQVTVTF